MRKRLWFSSFAVALIAVLIVGVPALVVSAGRGATALGVIIALMVVAGALAGWLTAVLAARLARPVEELAEAAARLGAGDPRPLGRRYGLADLDQVADGLDTSARRLSSLLAADRELAVDASHQLRTPLTALSMRLEEMIAAAEDPDVVREEGSAALTQAERLADVVTQLLSPARRATASTAALTGIDEIVRQQVIEWEPAFRRVRRKLVVIGAHGLQAHVTPGGLAQVLATLLDNALMHGGGTVTLQTSQNARSVVIEVRDEGKGVPPELVSRIFERSVSGRPEGTGLGLALARTMAAADGGRVVLVKPKPATFAVFLPRHPPRTGTQPVRGPALRGLPVRLCQLTAGGVGGVEELPRRPVTAIRPGQHRPGLGDIDDPGHRGFAGRHGGPGSTGQEHPLLVREVPEDRPEPGADHAGRVVGQRALHVEPVGNERDDALRDGQADDVQRGEQEPLAQQRLVDPVPEGPEPAAEVGDHGRRGDGQSLGNHGPDADGAVQVGRAAQVDDRADQADRAEFRELRNQIGEALAEAHHPGHTK